MTEEENKEYHRRYKKENYFKLTVRIYIDQKPILDRYVSENGTDINTLINELLSDAIIDFKPIRRGKSKPKYY